MVQHLSAVASVLGAVQGRFLLADFSFLLQEETGSGQRQKAKPLFPTRKCGEVFKCNRHPVSRGLYCLLKHLPFLLLQFVFCALLFLPKVIYNLSSF